VPRHHHHLTFFRVRKKMFCKRFAEHTALVSPTENNQGKAVRHEAGRDDTTTTLPVVLPLFSFLLPVLLPSFLISAWHSGRELERLADREESKKSKQGQDSVRWARGIGSSEIQYYTTNAKGSL